MNEHAVPEQASILVVDDNPLILNVMKGLLQAAQYNVFTSANGSEALTMLGNKCVDVIICDVMMPEMDGYELHVQVRKNPELSHIPFVFLTALDEQSEVIRGKEAGADEYLVKPFDPEVLLSVVRGKVVRSRNLKHLSEERFETYRKRVVHLLSHEFRTPLVAINTGTELLIDQHGALDRNRITSLLEAVHRGGQRLERLVSDFMLLQQIEAGVAARLVETRSRVCSFEDVVSQFVESNLPDLARDGFKVELKKLSDDVYVSVYEAHILDILGRLLSNARKFKGTELSIEIVMFNQSDEAVVEVRDRGIGMDIARVREAMDLFGQLDRDRLEQQGSGLGLAIANRFAALNKGRLEFENRKDGGTAARLVLPVYHPPQAPNG